MKESPALIRDWKELATLGDSATHTLEIEVENCNGWIKAKDAREDTMGTYLSTHTFYGSKHAYSTRILQDAGFNVQLANWDA